MQQQAAERPDARTIAKYVVAGLALAAMLALAPFFFCLRADGARLGSCNLRCRLAGAVRPRLLLDSA